MEVCKQGINEPQSVCEQVALIFAGTNGYLNDVPVDKVIQYTSELNEALSTRYKDFSDKFAGEVDKDDFSKDLIAEMTEIIKSFTESFISSL